MSNEDYLICKYCKSKLISINDVEESLIEKIFERIITQQEISGREILVCKNCCKLYELIEVKPEEIISREIKISRRETRYSPGMVTLGPHPDPKVEERAKVLSRQCPAENHPRFIEFIEKILLTDWEEWRAIPPSAQTEIKRAFWRWLAEQEIYGT